VQAAHVRYRKLHPESKAGDGCPEVLALDYHREYAVQEAGVAGRPAALLGHP